MKKYIIAMSLLAAVIGCNKQEEPSIQAQDGDLITIRAVLPQDVEVKGASVTRLLSWSWQAGDKLVVVGTTTEEFVIQDGFTAKQAEFVGKAPKGKKFSILYPGQSITTTDWSVQTQNGNDNLDHLRYEAALEGVDNYTEFCFSPDWAAQHGGSLKQVGVIKISIAMPAEITVPEKLTLSADEPIFYAGNAKESLSDKLTLNLSGITAEDRELVAWMNMSWNEVIVSSGATIYVGLEGNSRSMSRDMLLSKESVLKTGHVNLISLSSEGWTDEATNAHYAGGRGTKLSPWQIATAAQLRCVAGDLVPGSMRYFKLTDNIDLSGGDEWIPLNNVDPYNKYIHFDGNGKSITGLKISTSVAYPSFAGVLYGTVKDLSFISPSIGAAAQNTAVVAGAVGTSSKLVACEISGVTVTGATLSGADNLGAIAGQLVSAEVSITDCKVINSQFAGTSFYMGGAIGQIASSSTKNVITGCSVENCTFSSSHANNKSRPAGFVSIINGSATITDCFVKDCVMNCASSGRVGGFIGEGARVDGSAVSKCHVENCTIAAGQNSAGFIGVNYLPSISQCYVEGGSITANSDGAAGFTAYPEGNATIKCKISDCYSTMSVTGGSRNYIGGFVGRGRGYIEIARCFAAGEVSGTHANTGAFVGAIDVNSAVVTKCIGWNASMPFAGSIIEGVAGVSDNYAGMDGTLSSKASSLGWSSDVWDFGADTPKLK